MPKARRKKNSSISMKIGSREFRSRWLRIFTPNFEIQNDGSNIAISNVKIDLIGIEISTWTISR